MSVIAAIIDLESIFALSISGIFILTFCPRVGFWNFLEEVAFIFFGCSSSPSGSIFLFWTSVSTSIVTQVSVSLVSSLPCNSKSRVGSWSVFKFHTIMQDKWPPKYFKLTCSMNNQKLKHTHLQSIMTAKQNRLLPNPVGKCQHLPTGFGKSPKWKRFQAFFRLLPPHYGKC